MSPTTHGLTGYLLLHDPHANHGTAFPAADRRALGIEGLLLGFADRARAHADGGAE